VGIANQVWGVLAMLAVVAVWVSMTRRRLP
jgi:hypothetical protein